MATTEERVSDMVSENVRLHGEFLSTEAGKTLMEIHRLSSLLPASIVPSLIADFSGENIRLANKAVDLNVLSLRLLGEMSDAYCRMRKASKPNA